MQIFEYPYVIIIILALGFIILGAIGIAFAMKGMKAANGEEEKDFVNISKLENLFEKSGKSREDRTVIYAGVSFDNFQSIYSREQMAEVFEEIKKNMLGIFADGDIAVYNEKNFFALTNWNTDETREKINACIEINNKCLQKYNALKIVDIRIGAYFVSGTEISFEEAKKRAKQAYILAKNEDEFYAVWNVSSGKELDKKIKIENNIEKEIDNNRFYLEYQPVLDAKTKEVIGAEVLSRLNSESEGLLTPKSFMSAVDSVGVNEKFDYYIFEKNCKWIANDKTQRENYMYTINFSRTTLCEEAFAEKITQIAEKYGLKLSCLAVEILEDKNVIGEAKKHMIQNLSELKAKGMSILLDDFGSGFTTFGDLQNLDISVVKIDKSITQNAVTDTGFIILKNIISTAKDIGFKTLCEGIETQEHEEIAIKAGCDLLQGYYYYKPMPVSMLEKVLDKEMK